MAIKTAVVAIGGNSLIPDNSKRDMRFQWEAVRETCGHVAEMVKAGWHIAVTHGNGPQGGYILRRAAPAPPHVEEGALVMDVEGSLRSTSPTGRSSGAHTAPSACDP